MCLGVPLQVHSYRTPGLALCAAAEQPLELRPVETSLLEQAPRPGDWLLVHINIAIRALEPEEAGQINDVLLAVTAAAAGQPFEHLLADLINREPALPPHLSSPPPAEPTP